MRAPECKDCEHPDIDWCVDCCLRCKRLNAEIKRLRAELADIPGLARNAAGLRLLLKPGEWRRRVDGEQPITDGLGQDVAMLVVLMHRDRKELRELRRKIGEWAAEVEKVAYWPALIEEMMEEAGKCER